MLQSTKNLLAGCELLTSALGRRMHCCYCLVTESHSTLCNSMDWSPPGSSLHGISQARMPEWVAISLFGRSHPQGSNPHLLHCRQILYCLSHQRSPIAVVMHSNCCSFSLLSFLSCLVGAFLLSNLPLFLCSCKSSINLL